MKKIVHTRTHVAILALLMMVIFALFLVAVFEAFQPKGRVSCASFGSYEDAESAFIHGAYWLDADGDGIPCENRLNRTDISAR